MKPLATLHINRRRLYEKNCESTDCKKIIALYHTTFYKIPISSGTTTARVRHRGVVQVG